MEKPPLDKSTIEKFTKQLPELIKARDIMFGENLVNTSEKDELSTGDIVINNRDKELGFVVGKFSKYPELVGDQDTEKINKGRLTIDSKKCLYLVVTLGNKINKDDDSDSSSLLPNLSVLKSYGPEMELRVRYLKGKDLMLFDKMEKKGYFDVIEEIRSFCRDGCFMGDCTGCILQKYNKHNVKKSK